MGLFNFGKKKEKLKPAKPEKIKNREPKNDIEWVKKNYPHASEEEQQKILVAMSGGGFNPLDTVDVAVQNETTTKHASDDFNPLDANDTIRWIKEQKPDATDQDILNFFTEMAKPADDLDHLDEDGELPWGWHTANKEFTDKISKEFNYYLNNWIKAKESGNPKEYKSTLKSLITYIEDCQSMCKAKGETYEYWYEGIANHEYISRLKNDLKELEADFDRRVDVYDYMNKIPSFKEAIIETIRNNDGILQKDLPSFFMAEPEVKMKVLDALYELTKDGKVEKVKQGRTNMLKLK